MPASFQMTCTLYWRYESLLIPYPVGNLNVHSNSCYDNLHHNTTKSPLGITTHSLSNYREHMQVNKGYQFLPQPNHVCRMLSTLPFCYVDCHSRQLCNFPSNTFYHCLLLLCSICGIIVLL